MNRCPITYELCENNLYSKRGLYLLSKKLTQLNPFPYSSKEQIHLATQFATKLSIQGVQPKLSVKLNVAKRLFEVVETGGLFIFKPPHHLYEELPQNEDLTMKLASLVGIEIPLHGMSYNKDDSLTYFIKRFDRATRKQKIGVEDFSQLLGYSRDTKYESSMEKVISVVEKHCTFPMIEKAKLFRLTLFNFLIGNEDMHLKNFTLIRRNEKVELSPAYDLLNTAIVLQSKEEIALPIRGEKSKLTYDDLVDYFGIERLALPPKVLEKEISKFKAMQEHWKNLITNSFLSKSMQNQYISLIENRFKQITL